MFTRDIVKWCAKECTRQESGEMSVFRMYAAWEVAQSLMLIGQPLDDDSVRRLGYVVEPEKNRLGYRKVPVSVRGELLNPPRDDEVDSLLNNRDMMKSHEVYRIFEEIHPFIDGNGRVGSIIYNWLNDTLEKPVAPPDVFNMDLDGAI